MNQANEPAFPEPYINDPNLVLSTKPGLTKREYFAAMFAQGIIIGTGIDGFVQYEEETVAGNAIKMADELLKQLKS